MFSFGFLSDLTSNLDELYSVLKLFKININDKFSYVLEESSISLIIKKYCTFSGKNSESTKKTIISSLENLIQYLKMNNIPIKNRVYSPIIDMYYREKNEMKIIEVYKECETLKIKLLDIDFCKIICVLLENKSTNNDIFQKIILSMYNKISYLNYECINILHKYLQKTDINCKGICSVYNNQLLKICLSKIVKDKIINSIYDSNRKKSLIIQKYYKYIDSNDYDIVLDGANIGYFKEKQNIHNKINYKKINQVVTYFRNEGKKVLIVLHCRHFNNIKQNEKNIIKKWEKDCILLTTPKGINDDIFWLYAALIKKNVYIVTNDKIRDHKFLVNNKSDKLELSDFEYWFNDSNINYDFLNNKIKIVYPLSYSQRIQIIKENIYFPVYVNYYEWYILNII